MMLCMSVTFKVVLYAGPNGNDEYKFIQRPMAENIDVLINNFVVWLWTNLLSTGFLLIIINNQTNKQKQTGSFMKMG